MPVSFRILKNHGLVYVRYEGVATMDETMTVFAEYAQHPDCHPGLKQLVDLSNITKVAFDFPKLMEMQARKADVFMSGASETLMVYLAQSPEAISVSKAILRSWEPFPWVVPVVVEDESEALSILGMQENSLAELLVSVR